ncbi:sugar ABC transporter permease, partial [Clostridium perfringens]
METLKKMFKNNIRQYGMIIALVVIMIFFQIITGGLLLEPINITNLILQNSYILVLAIGMVLVIITGHIDLSVGSVAAFVGAVAAIMMVDMQLHPVIAVIVSLIVGGLIGAWQGFWVAYVRIPAFIVTLAGMLLFRGLTMIVLEGQSIAPFPS